MLLTAHGGALGTGRNSRKFFDIIRDFTADIIEVDIYSRRGLLYISHLPRLRPSKALTLSFVFDFIKRHGFMLNCDVKTSGLTAPVIELAREKGVVDKILFTGRVTKKDLTFLTAPATAYLNVSFFGIKPRLENLATIKRIIDTQNNDNIKGLNLNYKYCTDKMLDECARIGLALSVFTVDKTAEIDRLLKHKAVANITTNRIDYALEARAKLRHGD